jgi:conjugative transfer signal peptidase TraF
MKRYHPLAFGILFLLSLQLLSHFFPCKLMLYNYTDSLPHGLYLVWQCVPRKGDLVAFEPPEKAARLIRERKYLREGGYLMKYIVGEKGDSVCTDKGRLIVNGVDYGGIDAVDKEGRHMPRYSFCGIMTDGYIMAVKGMNSSFDSRYFGPVKNGSILGLVFPLIFFEY